MRRLKPWLGLFARLVLGGVLVTAGYLKAFNLSQAKMAVRAYEMFPIPVANIFGLALPWLEIGAGLLLLIGISVRYAAAFAGALMFFFILAISQAWARGLSIDCGCFGGGGQIDPSQTRYLSEIVRDAGLVLISFYLFRYPTSRFALEKLPENMINVEKREG
ncbi:MAG: DoxX family protein [Actinomycetota bacterium]